MHRNSLSKLHLKAFDLDSKLFKQLNQHFDRHCAFLEFCNLTLNSGISNSGRKLHFLQP